MVIGLGRNEQKGRISGRRKFPGLASGVRFSAVLSVHVRRFARRRRFFGIARIKKPQESSSRSSRAAFFLADSLG